MREIETKVLEVNIEEVRSKLLALGAKETAKMRLFIDWYSPKDATEDNHPWYLRVRSTSDGKHEISWKSLAEVVGNTRQSREVNLNVSDAKAAQAILEEIGLVHYAHQEKDRNSFSFKDWNFDIDQYPKMPAYLEIEGKSMEHVNEAITLLELASHESISEGERKLIQKKYGLDWYEMRF